MNDARREIRIDAVCGDYETIQGRIAYQWVPADTPALLEIGCSSGYLARRLTYKAHKIHGIDFNTRHVTSAKRDYPELMLCAGDAVALPYRGDVFDVVVMLEVFEHVDSRTKLLQEVFRVLRPGGLLILSTPNKGLFRFLDPFNIQVVAQALSPKLFDVITRRVFRYKNTQETSKLFWHRHFSLEEVERAISNEFVIEKIHRGGLLLFPVMGILRAILLRCCPSPLLLRSAVSMMNLDGGIRYGAVAYNLIVRTRRK